MSPLRVLMVSWEYPPVMYGGLGRHVHALSTALAGAGHDVVVLTQGPPGTPAVEGAPDGLAAPGSVRVVRAVLEPDAPDVYLDTAAFVAELWPALTRAAGTHLGGWTPQVVHGHDWVVAPAARDLAATLDAVLVATVHATETGLYGGHVHSQFSRWRHGVECSLVAHARRTIVCSTAMREEVVTGLGAAPQRVVVVPNGVDPAAWTANASAGDASAGGTRVRERLGLTDEPLLVMVGRLEHEKGAQDAVAAVGLLKHRDTHLAVVGDGARRDDLAGLARDLGLSERVHLLGRLRHSAVADVVRAADVALVPSRYEPFGIVALEAMAAGVPVVVTRTGGLLDVVDDGRTGVTVPPADPAALAAATDRLLADRGLRARLSAAAGREVTERFGWPAVARATAAVYADSRD